MMVSLLFPDSRLPFSLTTFVPALQTAESCFKHTGSDTGCPSSSPRPPWVLPFYTHHHPHLAECDLAFFTKASVRRWICEEIVTEQFKVPARLCAVDRVCVEFLTHIRAADVSRRLWR